MSNQMMGWGAIIVGVLIAATVMLGWNESLHYLWALLVLVWGAKALMNK